MERSEISEIKKLFSKYVEGDCAAGNVAGCIITVDKKIKASFSTKLLGLRNTEILKYLTVFKNIYATSNEDIMIQSGDKDSIQSLLEKINGTDLNNETLLNVLYEKIRDLLPDIGSGYAVLLMQYSYDIPIKDKNKEKQKSDSGDGVYGTESEETYKFISCAICPLKTGKECLVYNDKSSNEEIAVMNQLKTVESAVFGFAYPAFNNRTTDPTNVMCFRTDKLDISSALFGKELPKIEKKEKKATIKKHEPVETVKAPAATETDTYAEEKSEPSYAFNDDAYEEYDPVEKHEQEKEKQAAGSIPVKPRKVSIYGDKEKITKKTIDGKEYFLVLVSEAEIH